nr:hypothetical protein [Tanacetum cinerariifolium]
HKKEYDSWVNERQMQTTEEKVNTSKALDASLVDTESSGTDSKEQDTSSRLGNYAHDDDAYIRPIYDEELMAELLEENETLKKHYKELFDSIKITRAKTIEHTTSLIATNDNFKAQHQERGFAIASLKNELRKSIENSVNTKFAKSSILGKPMLQSHRNQSVVRQATAFKSERPRISKPRFASQVNVINDLSKPVTTHYLPKERNVASVKPHHMIASSNSRISSENMQRFSSNEMVHNHYLEEAIKKTQECRTSFGHYSSKKELRKLKGKVIVENAVTPPTIAPVVHKVDLEPLSPKLKNNREAHVDYIRITKENVNTLHAIVEQARTLNALDNVLAYALNDHDRATAVKSMIMKEWKPTGKMFKNVGYKWVPIGRSFTIVGTKCPLTRFTSTKIVPPKKPVKSTIITNIKPSSASQWRPKETNHASSSSAPKIIEYRTAKHLDPKNHMGSNVSISPCSSSV